MFVKVLGSAAGAEPGGESASRFADVPEDAYYAPYVAWAAETGVVKGTSDTTFSPEEPITREDMAVMLYQYAEACGFDTSYEEERLEAFPDSGEVAGYAVTAMAWAVTQGVLAGSGGYLEPKGVATRAETAQIFYNGREVLGLPEESPEEETPEEEVPGEEESPGEEVPPVVDTTPDAPWLEEQRKELEGGTHTLSQLGVTRVALLNELEAHEHDNYYLGTPYVPGDWQSPKGDTRYNGRAGMNCGGFVSYVLRKAGLRAEEAMGLITLVPGQSLVFGSGKAYGLLAGASNYRNLIKNAGLEAYVFSSPFKLISSGKAEKGDILFIDKGPNAKPGEDTHIGFYWEDSLFRTMWQSGEYGNSIGMIVEATTDPMYIIIKID
ncbi:MAG TPA: S-layer homology domain-containing protein [Candidatus Acutalibacter stercorigallinarum]|nr:S-layer homology domain-containing protein [Candidatus Acutalibacter stercorigallinarum]